MMMGYGTGWLGMGGLAGLLTMAGAVLLVVGVIVLVVWAVTRVSEDRARTGTPPRSPAAEDPLEVLRLRYARGEISADEYQAARLTLEAGR